MGDDLVKNMMQNREFTAHFVLDTDSMEDLNPEPDFPQDSEPNEYRYLSPDWLNEIAKGLTAGAKKHPGETWRKIPPKEHAWRAIRHLTMFLMDDDSESHLINASMRVMMAYETEENGTR